MQILEKFRYKLIIAWTDRYISELGTISDICPNDIEVKEIKEDLEICKKVYNRFYSIIG